MRHLKKGRKFGRETDQRHALMKALASAFFLLGRIKTTEAKAKELRPFAEKFIHRAKNPTLASKRMLHAVFAPKIVTKLVETGKSMAGKSGGYTRIIRLGARKSDSAKMAIIELAK